MPRYIISTRDEFDSDYPDEKSDRPRQDAHAHEHHAGHDDMDPVQRAISAPTGPSPNSNTNDIEKPPLRVQSYPDHGSRLFASRRGTARRKRRSAAPTSATLYGMSELTSPWSHSRAEKRPSLSAYSSTIREFNPRRQRVRLFVKCSLQWLVTVALCVGMAGCLYGYSQQHALSSNERHTFNALVTIFAMAIGLNVASSLRSYAKILRWRFLAYRYRTLEEFEAVMNCESLRTVFRLMWSGSRRKRLLVPSQTQILAFLSLAINLLLQVTIALIGFAYSIDVSTNSLELKQGLVSVLDLSTISDPYNEAGSAYSSQAANANDYGISGEDFTYSPGSVDDNQPDFQSFFSNKGNASFFYRFYDDNPNPNSTEIVLSIRTVSATATCKNYTVISGGYAGYGNDDDDVHYLDEDNNKGYLFVPDYASGSATWLANSSATCGDRCTQVFVLFSADNVTVPKPLLFECKNTVGQVTNTSHYKESDKYLLPDEQARILAGAIGYSGISFGDQSLEDHVYAQGQYWSPTNISNTSLIGNNLDTAFYLAGLLMQFSIGALVAMDNLAPRINVQGLYPVQAQVANVTWLWAGLILGGIVAFQLVFLLFTLSWSNRAIIRDGNYFSIAKLLQPLVAQLGDHGCLLTGDEIAEQLNNVKVSYGVRVPDGFERGNGVGHVDIIYESERMPLHSRMPPGRYDGSEAKIRRRGCRKIAPRQRIPVPDVRRWKKIRAVRRTDAVY